MRHPITAKSGTATPESGALPARRHRSCTFSVMASKAETRAYQRQVIVFVSCYVTASLVLIFFCCLFLVHAPPSITTLWTFGDQYIHRGILFHWDNIYLAIKMGALLSIPLLAVPSMGTVCQHKHLMAGRH